MPRIGDVTILERTGKSWEEWFALLDEAGAAERPHTEIARSLVDEHGLSGWWAQSIIAASPDEVWRAWEDETLREQWLPGAQIAVRTATKPKTMRLDWGEGGRLAVYFDVSGEQTRLAVQHEKLPDKETAERWKAFWRERVAALKDLFEKEER